MRDRSEKNRVPVGELAGLAKLTEQEAREIKTSLETNVALGKRFGVSPVTVSHCRLGRTWKHVV